MKYTFRKVGIEHGFLSVSDEEGNLLATGEVWHIVDEDEIKRFESHECKPGQMIPMGDPRWYTHCQWCGESVEGQDAGYYIGQYHYPACYKHRRKG